MNRIESERRRQSMTQKRLAFESGIDARTLRKMEKGEQVSPESYRAVCQALGRLHSIGLHLRKLKTAGESTYFKNDEAASPNL